MKKELNTSLCVSSIYKKRGFKVTKDISKKWTNNIYNHLFLKVKFEMYFL